MRSPSALLFDLQGVLIDERQPLPGAVETVTQARRRGLPIRFLTNTATRSQKALLDDLRELGFCPDPEELITAPLAALRWIEREGLRPMILVHPAIAPLFAAHAGSGPPDCVLLGDARDQLSFAHLNAALELLLQGAPLIGIGRNRRFREGGRWMLDAGAFLAALEYGAGCEAIVMGKPSAAFFREVTGSLALPPAACLMIGDDVEADVCGARTAGLQAALVQTGKYRITDLERLPSDAALLDSIGSLGTLLGW
jgi:HAD superfamily hydrolase (TIGR01458 family)